MIYTQLPSKYKYRTLADAIYAREVEYFHFDFDRANFEHIVANTAPSTFRDSVEKRLQETRSQMENVLAIIAALRFQIDDEEAYNEAVLEAVREREVTKK